MKAIIHIQSLNNDKQEWDDLIGWLSDGLSDNENIEWSYEIGDQI